MSIKVKELTHIYSEGLPHQSTALSQVSFEIEDGEFVGIIGHTGSGKSTLVQHLNGLLKPKSGSIVIGGINITDGGVVMRDIRRKVGLVFQYPEYQLFEETVQKDVAYGPSNLGLSPEETEERVREALALVELDFDEIAERSPFELSGGQKRRVAIAGVIAMQPEILILDEPTAGLDPKAHRDILDMIRYIHSQTRNITILISHNMNDIAELADKVLVLDKGQVADFGKPQEVFAKRGPLLAMGLSLPSASEMMHRLTEGGISVRTGIFSSEEAAAELLQYFQNKRDEGEEK